MPSVTFTLRFALPGSSTFSAELPLSAWGLARPRRHLVSQAASTVSLLAQGAASDAEPLFPYGSIVVITKTTASPAAVATAATWFYGIVTKTPARGTGRAESCEYEISDPWWFLENLVYQQQWVPPSYPGANQTNDPYRSHCFLNKWIAVAQPGGGLYFARTPTDVQIRDAINFAQTFNSIPLQLAADIPSMDIPLQEVRDITCAEVIRKQLRWMPDAVTWFDYATTPPTLHITRRIDLAPVIVSLTPIPGAPLLASFSLSPRFDLYHPSVALKFEQIDQIDQQFWLQLTSQIYPPTATGHELQALVLTVALEGLDDKVASASINVSPVQTSAAIDPSRDGWWLSKQPWLQRCTTAAITSLSFETANGPGLPVAHGATFSNELLSGQITPWMAYAAAECIVTAVVDYTIHQPVPGDPPEGPYTGPLAKSGSQTVSVKVQMTSAPAGQQTLYSLASSIAPEQIPANLAETLWQSVGFVPYEGRLALVEQDCSGSVSLGNVLNLVGGAQSAWASMNATVQQINEDLETGATQISFGPPAHLGAPDLVEILRLNRFRIVYTNPAMQGQSAQVQGRAQLGQQTALENSVASGSTYQTIGTYVPAPSSNPPHNVGQAALNGGLINASAQIQVGTAPDGALPANSPSTQGSITLRQSDCNGKDLYIQQIQICVDGVVKNIMVPCSSPF